MTCPVSSTPRRIQALSKSFLLTLTTTLSQESLIELLKYDEAKGWGIFVLKASILSLLISVCLVFFVCKVLMKNVQCDYSNHGHLSKFFAN